MSKLLVSLNDEKQYLDLTNQELIAKAGKEFVLNGKASNFLLAIKNAQALLESIETILKDNIKLAFKEVSNSETGAIVSDVCKVNLQSAGARFYLDKDISKIESKFYSEEIKYKLNIKAVEEHIKEFGTMPVGIYENVRNVSVVIKPNKSLKVDLDGQE